MDLLSYMPESRINTGTYDPEKYSDEDWKIYDDLMEILCIFNDVWNKLDRKIREPRACELISQIPIEMITFEETTKRGALLGERESPLSKIIINGNLIVMNFILTQKFDFFDHLFFCKYWISNHCITTNVDCLILAVCKGQILMAQLLLDSGCNIEFYDQHGRSTSDFLMKYGGSILCESFMQEKLKRESIK